MKDYHFNVFYSDEDGGYIADIPDLKYCSAFGKTPVQALREVEKAKDLWLETARDLGKRNSQTAVSPGNLSTSKLITNERTFFISTEL